TANEDLATHFALHRARSPGAWRGSPGFARLVRPACETTRRTRDPRPGTGVRRLHVAGVPCARCPPPHHLASRQSTRLRGEKRCPASLTPALPRGHAARFSLARTTAAPRQQNCHPADACLSPGSANPS